MDSCSKITRYMVGLGISGITSLPSYHVKEIRFLIHSTGLNGYLDFHVPSMSRDGYLGYLGSIPRLAGSEYHGILVPPWLGSEYLDLNTKIA